MISVGANRAIFAASGSAADGVADDGADALVGACTVGPLHAARAVTSESDMEASHRFVIGVSASSVASHRNPESISTESFELTTENCH